MASGTGGRSHQSYRERYPRPELARVLSCVWIHEVAGDEPAYEHRTVPNGSAEIVCVLGTGAVHVVGPKRTPVVERLPPGTTAVGLRFRPGVASAVLRTPASELVDDDVALDALWGASAAVIGPKLADASSPEQATALLEDEVRTRWAVADEPDPIVGEAVKRLQPWRQGHVGGAVTDLFISSRQLRRRFGASLGYGPKTLQRILRFQAFLALGNDHHGDDVTLAWLASAAGYTDQAHLSHECVRLAGLTPGTFLAEMRRSCAENHDHAASFSPLLHALRRS